MADGIPKENAAKARIIDHMNEDHHDSIVRFLEHYCKVPSWRAHNGRMCGVDLNGMSFVVGKTPYRIPLNPPMSSYREARERVVAMDKESLAGLGRSDITIKEYLPPTGLQAVMFLVIVATFVGYSQRWWFAREGPVAQTLGSAFARFSWIIQPYLFIFLIVVHSAETVYFARTKLAKHSVSPGTTVFWKWVGSVFIEGVFGMGRFDGLVQAKREEKAKQKH